MQDTYKQTAIKAAKEAGRIQLKYFGKTKEIKYKDKTNAVTNADLEAEKEIITIIKNNFPEHNILSEEAGAINKKSQYKWLIDPLDGTHNYMHGVSLFGVSIALEFKKEVILGVIYLPYFNHLYVAEKGKGAFLNNKKIRVSNIKELRKIMMYLDGGFHRETTKRLRLIRTLTKHMHKIRTVGVAVFDLVYVAEGKVDASILFPTNPWDIAAGIIIIKEAGGKVTDFNGREADQYSKCFLASNNKVHSKILNVLKK